MECEVTGTNFEKEVLKAEEVVLVDFWATWCEPCQRMLPIIKGIAEEFKGKLKVAKVNIDNASQLAATYQVQAVPTLCLFKNGKLLKTLIGVQSKQKLKEEIQAIMK
jgi:thioredoxin 1